MIQQKHEQRSSFVTSNCLKFCYFLIFLLFVGCGNEEKKNLNSQENLSTETQVITANGKKTILCFGDSITAGYGLDDINDAYPSVLQSKIDSLNLDYEVVQEISRFCPKSVHVQWLSNICPPKLSKLTFKIEIQALSRVCLCKRIVQSLSKHIF